jgi:hypothetical protein
MADQDFNINIRINANTAQVDAIRQSFEKLGAQVQVTNAQAAAGGAGAGGGIAGAAAGLTGASVGLGTITALLTGAISKWKEFNDELGRTEELSLKSIEKMHELGMEILDMQDKARSAARIGTEPLEVSVARLTQDLTRLKTEIDIAFQAGEFDEVKKLTADLKTVESQLDRVTSALQRQKAEADKAAKSELEKRVPGLKPDDAVKEADLQTQRILMNEQAAAKARAEGRDKDADMFDKSAELYKKSATPQQLQDLQRIHELQDKLKGPAAPTYQPLSPEEFQRQSEAAEPAGAGKKLTREEMTQHQLDARADRYQGIQKTREEGAEAEKDRKENNRLLARILETWQ